MRYRTCSLLLACFCTAFVAVRADVVSDVTIVLSDDLTSMTLKETISSNFPHYIYAIPGERLALEPIVTTIKNEGVSRLVDQALHIPSQRFSVIYKTSSTPGLSQTSTELWEFSNMNSEKRGFTASGGYNIFSATWVFPENTRIEHYHSNIPSAHWKVLHNIVQLSAKDSNNIQFKIAFTKDKHTHSNTEIIPDKVSQCDNKTLDTLQAIVCGQQSNLLLRGVKFPSNSANLSPNTRASLDKLIDEFLHHRKHRFEIASYTDSQGPKKWNKRLSQDRADTIRLYLIYKGVKPHQLRAKGYGETNPVASNESAEGRALNRRIEITLVEEKE